MILLQIRNVGTQMQPPPWTFFQNTTLSPEDKPGPKYQLTTIEAEQPLAHSLHSCNPLVSHADNSDNDCYHPLPLDHSKVAPDREG